jgi:hypothetical protein
LWQLDNETVLKILTIMDDKKYFNKIRNWTIVLGIVPLFFYLYKFGSLTFSADKGDWGTFGDYLGGTLNPLLGILTLAVTVYIAMTFNDYEKRRDKQTKDEADVKSYLELYQYFTGAEFREKRHTAWNVVRKAIENKEYKDFLIRETFVSRYVDRMERDDVYKNFKSLLYTDKELDKREFLHLESEDRHKLDSVINFFQLLAIKDIPDNYHSICDFYYDSWRPILYWYAREIEIGYNLSPGNKKYNNPPTLKAALALLDKKYYKPTTTDMLTYDNIDEHPILNWYINGNNGKKSNQ